jgi:hypothetical protein
VFVGETRVSLVEGSAAVWEVLKEDWKEIGVAFLPARLYHVKTEGGAMLDILCEGLEWEMQPVSLDS